MITVFFDGKCGLCRREISHYQRIAPSAVFEWVDITTAPQAFIALGLKVEDGLKILHATDSQGSLYQGVDAFALIWQALPRWQVLAFLVRLPLVRPCANAAYNAFAAWRFKRLGYAVCER